MNRYQDLTSGLGRDIIVAELYEMPTKGGHLHAGGAIAAAALELPCAEIKGFESSAEKRVVPFFHAKMPSFSEFFCV